MGKVMENIKLTNDYDFALALAGGLDPAKVRTVEIEALVDTGATTLILPADGRGRLGLPVRGHAQGPLRRRSRRNGPLGGGREAGDSGPGGGRVGAGRSR